MNKKLIITCGLQCSGKSTLSSKLSQSLSIARICTDDFRVRLFANPHILKSNPLDRHLVYWVTLFKAEEILLNGQSVIIDGTFSIKTFRQGAYFVAEKTGASPYLIYCECNNYGLIQQRYEQRQEQKKSNTHLFEEWTTVEPFKKLYLEFQRPDREVLPDGIPVPVIRYDSEQGRAEVIYSDGSETIHEIIEAINKVY